MALTTKSDIWHYKTKYKISQFISQNWLKHIHKLGDLALNANLWGLLQKMEGKIDMYDLGNMPILPKLVINQN